MMTNTLRAFAMTALLLTACFESRAFPSVASSDPAIEREMREAAARSGGNATLQRVAVTSDWTIVRHPVTGIVMGRVIRGALGFRDREGKCFWNDVAFAEEMVAGKFGRLQATSVQNTYDTSCQDVAQPAN
jgi:hypothetical protein